MVDANLNKGRARLGSFLPNLNSITLKRRERLVAMNVKAFNTLLAFKAVHRALMLKLNGQQVSFPSFIIPYSP